VGDLHQESYPSKDSVQARELKLKLFLVYGDKSQNFDLLSDTSYVEKVEATLVPSACSEEQCD